MTYMNHITYKIHTIKLIFEAYKKKLKKFFLHFFFSLYKNYKQRLSKTQRKTPKRGTGKVSKSF